MLTVNENTYITVSEADEIVRTHLDKYDGLRLFWGVLDEEDKEVYLTKAIEQMETIMLPGRKKSPVQALSFPRFPSCEVPKDIKLAQAYNALGFFNEDIKGASQETIALYKRFGVHLGVVSASDGAILGETASSKGFPVASKKAAEILQKYRRGGFRMR